MGALRWLTRVGRLPRRRSPALAPAPAGPVVRSAPGLAALFEGLEPTSDHAVLDLGAAAETSLSVYSGLARQVRFADLGASASATVPWAAALEDAGRNAAEPYDVLLLWDTLGRLSPQERPVLMARLLELAAPGARMHLVVEAPERTGPRPHRFSLADPAHMRHDLTWDTISGAPRLTASAIEKVIAPFQVERGFTLKDGLREYVAVRRAKPPAPAAAPGISALH